MSMSLPSVLQLSRNEAIKISAELGSNLLGGLKRLGFKGRLIFRRSQ